MNERLNGQKVVTSAERRGAEILAARWLLADGIPRHMFGFHSTPGYYLVITCMVGTEAKQYPVPSWGGSVLKTVCEQIKRDWRAQKSPAQEGDPGGASS